MTATLQPPDRALLIDAFSSLRYEEQKRVYSPFSIFEEVRLKEKFPTKT
jgi:hypothetical protein